MVILELEVTYLLAYLRTYLNNYLLTPWSREANRFSASQKIPYILWNPKVHYRVYNCPSPVPILSQFNPVHALNPTLWRSILILSYHLRLWPLSLSFHHQNRVCTSPVPHTCFMAHHLILLDFVTRTMFSEKYRKLSFSLCSLVHSPIASSLLGSNILLSTLFSKALTLHSSISVSDQVSHPYKTISKIIVPYVLICVFLDSKLEDKGFCTEW